MRKLLTIIAIGIMVAGCGKGSKDTVTPPAPSPGKASLLFPAKDELCNQGTIISSTQNKVVLKWSSAANADSYSISYTNLLTQIRTLLTSTQNQLEVTLDRNTPYAWYVTALSSKNTAVTTQSDTWKFYNSGPGITSYAPFPAEAVSPTMGATVSVGAQLTCNITWKANDVDNDIVNFDVYLDDKVSPVLYASKITNAFVQNFPVKKGITYYWKIATRDAKGNISYSDTYQFTVAL